MFKISESGCPFTGVDPKGHPQISDLHVLLAHSLDPRVPLPRAHYSKLWLIPGAPTTPWVPHGLRPPHIERERVRHSALQTRAVGAGPGTVDLEPLKPKSGNLGPPVLGPFSDCWPDSPL